MFFFFFVTVVFRVHMLLLLVKLTCFFLLTEISPSFRRQNFQIIFKVARIIIIIVDAK